MMMSLTKHISLNQLHIHRLRFLLDVLLVTQPMLNKILILLRRYLVRLVNLKVRLDLMGLTVLMDHLLLMHQLYRYFHLDLMGLTVR
jgi:hypothetical protein